MIWLLHDMIRCSSLRTMEYYTHGDWTVCTSNQFMPPHTVLIWKSKIKSRANYAEAYWSDAKTELLPSTSFSICHKFVVIVLILTSCRLCLFIALLYRSPTGRHFYGTENEIWAGFGPVGNTEKMGGQLWATFEGVFFMFSGAKKWFKLFFKNIVAFALKSCIKWRWENKKKNL